MNTSTPRTLATAAMSNYGLIVEPRKPEDWVFGGGNIKGDVLVPDGQWTPWLPSEELQNLYGVEPYACATFGTFNAIETLIKRQYGQTENWSDRWTAKMSGTEFRRGNSPHTVAEYIRKLGAVREIDWPFSPDIRTFEDYYKTPPASLARIAEKFTFEYRFYHDYIDASPEQMIEALKYTPIGASVNAWYYDSTGHAVKMGPDDHWVVIYGYKFGDYWMAYDTYSQTTKHIDWTYNFEVLKGYQITRVPVTDRNTIAALIADKIRLIRKLLNI